MGMIVEAVEVGVVLAALGDEVDCESCSLEVFEHIGIGLPPCMIHDGDIAGAAPDRAVVDGHQRTAFVVDIGGSGDLGSPREDIVGMDKT